MRKIAVAVIFIILFPNFSEYESKEGVRTTINGDNFLSDSSFNVSFLDEEKLKKPPMIDFMKEIYKNRYFPLFLNKKYEEWKKNCSIQKININSDDYTPHPPIYINGNDDFTPENGVVAGNGTKENPYIIEGWEINASNADGIRIENTTVYFVIRNCYIHDNNGSAIYLFSVLNGCMLNNICSANANYGVFVHFSHYNVINKCSISNNGIGGVCLYFSLNNSIHNCNFLNNGVFIWGSRLSHYIHNIRDNKINDKELFYIVNGSNIKLGNLSAGQLFLVGCNNVIIKNMVINNVEIGIEIIFCKNILLEGNSFLKIGIGILISRSKIISIINSSFSENDLFGIYAGDSSKVEINGCKIYRSYYSITLGSVNISIIKNCSLFNNYYGILLYNTHDSIITYCKMGSNNLFGLMLWYSRRSRISYNLCLNNRIDGLSVYSSSNNTIENNFCMNNFKGIAIRDAYYNVFLLNNCSENRQGILLTNTYLNIIVSNRCYRNDIGIYLYNSSNNSIENNFISYNSYNGIALQKSHYNFIYKNNISDYNCIGIMIEESYGNRIIGNNIINNEWIGIGLIKSFNNKIHYNNIYENQIYGMAGFLCFDNARYNYWGSWKGPGLFLNYKFWKKFGFGNPIIAWIGWIRYFPWKVEHLS